MSESKKGRDAPLPRGKRIVFSLVTLSVPFLFFIALEAGLRLAGYGSGYPLFVPVAGSGGAYLEMNPRVGHRFFTGDFVLPGVTRNRFLAEKPAETYRIVVQGASTVLGYPYFHGGAFPRMLGRRLGETFPDRSIEVVNTAMVAVNSYTLLDFADEIVRVQPDAVLVYVGHNEYYGAMGVASTQRVRGSRQAVRAWLALRRLRTVQLGQAALAAVAGGRREAPTDGDDRTWSSWSDMVPFGSRLYERGIGQFRANLHDLLDRYAEAGVPVFLATVVGNDRDRPPFVSTPDPGVGPDLWDQAARTALRRIAAGDVPGARRSLDAVTRRDSLNAEAFFSVARALDEAGHPGLARELYVGARDRDHLRFRAPSTVNAVIREAAASPEVRLVDVEQAFLDASPTGIVGGDLLNEHVHPRLEGAFLIADSFYEALREAGEIGAWQRPVPRDAARAEPTYTAVDSIYGNLLVHQLTSGWPFQPGEAVGLAPSEETPEDPVRRIAEALHAQELSWPVAMQQLYDHHYAGGRPDRARRVARALVDEYPELTAPLVLWGMAALRAGDAGEALAVTRRAHEMEASHRTALMHGLALLAAERRTEALTFLEEAAAAAPAGEPGAARALDAARTLPELEAAADVRASDPAALVDLADAYARVHQVERALETVRRALDVAPSHAGARSLLERLRSGTPPGGP